SQQVAVRPERAPAVPLAEAPRSRLDFTSATVRYRACRTPAPNTTPFRSALVVGTVTDTAMTPNSATHGISSNNSDVKLTVLAGRSRDHTAEHHGAEHIMWRSVHLKLNVTGNVSQVAGNVILASGLQLLDT